MFGGGLGAIFGGATQVGMNAWQHHAQRHSDFYFNKKLQDRSVSQAVDLQRRGPQAYMQGLREAGINPILAFGKGPPSAPGAPGGKGVGGSGGSVNIAEMLTMRANAKRAQAEAVTAEQNAQLLADTNRAIRNDPQLLDAYIRKKLFGDSWITSASNVGTLGIGKIPEVLKEMTGWPSFKNWLQKQSQPKSGSGKKHEYKGSGYLTPKKESVKGTRRKTSYY